MYHPPLPKLGRVKKEKKINKYDKLCYLFWFPRLDFHRDGILFRLMAELVYVITNISKNFVSISRCFG